ncbi:MAG: class I SAM-dependent methyltransferase [Dongiaceae bacterium]
MTKGGLTRLERFIARTSAQRACIDAAARATDAVAGDVWEVGLGNGRTYDHLRERFPDRDIVVFDREIAAHPDCVPSDDMMRLGDFRTTIPEEIARAEGRVAVIHADIGTANIEKSRAMGRWLAPIFAAALAPGGYLIGDQPMEDASLEKLKLADACGGAMPADAYFFYRKRA